MQTRTPSHSSIFKNHIISLALTGIALAVIELSLLLINRTIPSQTLFAYIALLLFSCCLYLLLSLAILTPIYLIGYFAKRSPNPYLLSSIPLILLTLSIVTSYDWSSSKCPNREPVKRKNLILLTLDTLRSDFVGCYGNSGIKTPVLDRLSRKGALFSQVVCPAPMTTPSHASILTATLPARHGAQDNRYRLEPANDTLAEMARDAGYDTAAFVSCYPLARKFGLNQGFMRYDDQFIPHGGIYEITIIRRLAQFISRNKLERSADELLAALLPWLTVHQKNQFFFWAHFFDPHAPYNPPLPYRNIYQKEALRLHSRLQKASVEDIRRSCNLAPKETGTSGLPIERYAAEITYLDAMLGMLINELARLNLIENTLIVITADHGEGLGEHGYFYSHGALLHEPAMMVPLLLIGFDPAICGHAYSEQVRLIDIAPTILATLGISSKTSHEGTNLISYVTSADVTQPLPALIENIGVILAPGYHKLRGVRLDNWKYVENPEQKMCEGLYDIHEDPYELTNKCNDTSELTTTLARVMRSGFQSTTENQISGSNLMDKETEEKLNQLGYFK